MALDPIELTALDADPTEEDEAPLVLSTIHSAKGLEFHTVFIIHALDGILPSGYALKDPDAVDEELRLLYVAVTRAEENLFISYPILQYRRFQGQYLTEPSRFIRNVPDRLLEEMELVEDRSAALPEGREVERLEGPADGDGSAGGDGPNGTERDGPAGEADDGRGRVTEPDVESEDGLPF